MESFYLWTNPIVVELYTSYDKYDIDIDICKDSIEYWIAIVTYSTNVNQLHVIILDKHSTNYEMSWSITLYGM